MSKTDKDTLSIGVPTSWADITLGHYETFYMDRPETPRDRVALVAKICRMDLDELLAQPVGLFNEIVRRIGFVFGDNPAAPNPSSMIGDTEFVVPIEEALTLGAWVDAEAVQQSGEHVLSGVLAIVCRPAGEEYDYRNNEARQRLFAGLPVSDVLPVLAFFLACRNASDRRTAISSGLARMLDRLPRSIAPLRSLGGGTRLSRTLRAMRYNVSTALPRYRLRRLLRSFDSSPTGGVPTLRNTDTINE